MRWVSENQLAGDGKHRLLLPVVAIVAVVVVHVVVVVVVVAAGKSSLFHRRYSIHGSAHISETSHLKSIRY